MAEPHLSHATDEAEADAEAYLRGSMEINEQTATWNLFMGMAKYGSLTIAAAVAFLTLWFAVGAGMIAGGFVFVVIMAVGIFFLRKPKAH